MIFCFVEFLETCFTDKIPLNQNLFQYISKFSFLKIPISFQGPPTKRSRPTQSSEEEESDFFREDINSSSESEDSESDKLENIPGIPPAAKYW